MKGGRTFLLAGALLTAVGLATAALVPVARAADAERLLLWQRAGGVMLLAGWAVLAWGIHRFGRSGAP